jgi:type I restriction enzyme S subunit
MKWPSHPISELCTLAVDCVNKTAPTVDYETPFKMIRTTNVKEGFIYLDDVSYVTEEVFEKWTRRSRPQYGDVILTREAPVGQVGRFTSNEDTIFLGQRLFHYRPNPDLLDWNYLAFVLQSHEVQGRLRGMGFGATVEHIKVGDAEHLKIPCPPVEVQRRIGDILSAYDDLIENNRRRIALLEEAARQLYREWFVRLRFPGHEHTRIIDSPLGPIAEGWRVVRLGDITTRIGSGATPRGGQSAYQEQGITLIRSLNVYDERFADEGLAFLDDDQAAQLSHVTVEPRDILLNITGASVARCCMVPERHLPARVNQHVMIIRVDATLADPSFVLCAINSDQRKRQLLSYAQVGATREALTKETVTNFEIVLPDEKLLRQFGEIARDISQQREVLAHQNADLRAARDLLLPRLMSGEIAV